MNGDTFKFTMIGDDQLTRPLKQAENQMKNLGNQVAKTNKQMGAFGSNLVGTGRNIKRFAMGSLQQAGYQIGDYAVQVANGTSRMQAFGQQAPQFLQIFGPIGSAVGAAVAIFAAYSVAAEKTAEANAKASKAAKTFADAIQQAGTKGSEAANVLRLASETDVASAKKVYSDFDGELKGFITTLASLKKEQAEASGITAAKRFMEEKDVLGKLRTEYNAYLDNKEFLQNALKEELADREANLKLAREEFNAIGAQIKMYEDLNMVIPIGMTERYIQAHKELMAIQQENLSPFRQSLTYNLSIPEEVIKTILDYEEAIKKAISEQNFDGAMQGVVNLRKALMDLPEDQRKAVQPAILELEGLLRTIGLQIDDNTYRAVEFKKAIYDTSSAARTLANNLSDAAQSLSDGTELAIIQAQIDAINAGYGKAGAAVAKFRKQKEIELGLSEAGSAAEEAYINAVINRSVEQYKATMQANGELDKLMEQFNKAGKSGSDAFKKVGLAARKLTPEMKRLRDFGQAVGQSFENSMMGMIDGTIKAKDAFRSMAVDIIHELYRIFIVKKVTGFITDMFDMASLPKGVDHTGTEGLPRFEGGGYTGSGARSGGMDGKGGFMAMLHPNETVVDHTKGQGGGVTIVQNINVSTGVQQTVRTEIKSLMPQIAESAKSAVLQAKRRGGSYGRAFA